MAANLLFYLFAALAVGSALAVVFNRNAVNAAVCLLVSLLGVAGVFVQLDALLLAVLLILVYAGAVVALFLFIVMLINPQTGGRRSLAQVPLVAGGFAAVLLGLGIFSLVTRARLSTAPVAEGVFHAGLKDYGVKLFTTYLLPVEIVGFLLLMAMLGVIVLSKKFEEQEDAK